MSGPRILVLTFYFEPDLSAGSFRTTALVRALADQLAPGGGVDVITTLPNRYSSFTSEASEREERGPVHVTRIRLPAHRGGMADQSCSFFTFAREATRLASQARYDVVFATSSRLMTGVLGSWIARRQGAPLYLDIRDIFVDTIGDVLRGPQAQLMQRCFAPLERFAVTRAARVNLVSEGFAPYFRQRYPGQAFSFHTNGVDDEFVEFSRRPDTAAPPRPTLRVVYAGNIGEGQGLHMIVPELARRLRGRAEFVIIGDGGRRLELEQSLGDVGNVRILAPMPRGPLLNEYAGADVLLLHLNDYAAFRKVLPSKIFEYAATGKPIWAGVAGHAAAFLEAHVDNAAVFAPLDVDGAVRALALLRLGTTPRVAFVERHSRAAISAALAEEILTLARHE